MSATAINFVWKSSARIVAITDPTEQKRKAAQLWDIIDRRDTDCEVLWSILAGVIPSAFTDPSDVNSIIREDDHPECRGLTATYSPEDDKLRLYAQSRLSPELYARVKAAGFKWAPKQELFVAPNWTPGRETLLLELCGEIGDEDYSPEERAADRAERFSGYRDKRRAEAHTQADRFDAGPSAFGHQSRSRAERQAARHDRFRGRAVSQWSKAEYWQQRTSDVISHALFKSSPEVRRGRILRLEAEQRKHLKSVADLVKRWELWSKVATLPGADQPGVEDRETNRIGIAADSSPAFRMAYSLANAGCYGFEYQHPRKETRSSLYSLLTDPQDPITPNEAAQLWFGNCIHPLAETSRNTRWTRHYELRLTYERAMLANEGGSAADNEMEVGGWLGCHQIQAVTRSPATKKVTSVKVYCEKTWNHEAGIRSVNIQRLGKAVYRAPTDEERAQFATATKERKATEKATKPAAPSLINPTDEDAQKLQDIWNAQALADHKRRGSHGDLPVSTVSRMTQAEYSENSKGTYSHFAAVEVTEKLCKPYQSTMNIAKGGRVAIFKIRKRSAGGFNYAADRVIVITDKPQKPLPWKAVEEARAQQPTEESMFPRLEELARAGRNNWLPREKDNPEYKLMADGVYLGWFYIASMSQFGFTDAGNEKYQEFLAQTPVKETAGV